MVKIYNRKAFFRNPKSADGLNANERRKLKRIPLHNAWVEYQQRKEGKTDARRVIVVKHDKDGGEKEREKKHIEEQSVNVHIDREDYEGFLREEKRQTLIGEIKDLEEQVRRKKEREENKKTRKSTKKGH